MFHLLTTAKVRSDTKVTAVFLVGLELLCAWCNISTSVPTVPAQTQIGFKAHIETGGYYWAKKIDEKIRETVFELSTALNVRYAVYDQPPKTAFRFVGSTLS